MTPELVLHRNFPFSPNHFDWKSAGVFYTHRVSGMPGRVTRLLACTDEQRAVYPAASLALGPTFVHHNHRGDERMNYAAFNKPASVNYWVNSGAVPEGVEFVMQLDADMLIHRPVHPWSLGVRPGVVLSAPYDHLAGTGAGREQRVHAAAHVRLVGRPVVFSQIVHQCVLGRLEQRWRAPANAAARAAASGASARRLRRPPLVLPDQANALLLQSLA